MLKKILFLLTLGLATHINTTSIKADNAIDQLKHDAYHEISANLLELNCTDQEIADLITNGSEEEDLWRSRFEFPQKKSKKRDFLYFTIGATVGVAAVALCFGSIYWYALCEEKKILQELSSNADDTLEELESDNKEDENGKEEQVKEPIEKQPPQEELPEPKKEVAAQQQNQLKNEKVELEENYIDQAELKAQAQQKIKFICSKMVEKKDAIEKKYEDLLEAKRRKFYQEQYSDGIYTDNFLRASQQIQDQRITLAQNLLNQAQQAVKKTKEEIINLAQEFDALMNERMGVLMDKENKFKGNGHFSDFIDRKSIDDDYKFRDVVNTVRTVKRNLGLIKGWKP